MPALGNVGDAKNKILIPDKATFTINRVYPVNLVENRCWKIIFDGKAAQSSTVTSATPSETQKSAKSATNPYLEWQFRQGLKNRKKSFQVKFLLTMTWSKNFKTWKR